MLARGRVRVNRWSTPLPALPCPWDNALDRSLCTH
jgi:hypothetical protein